MHIEVVTWRTHMGNVGKFASTNFIVLQCFGIASYYPFLRIFHV